MAAPPVPLTAAGKAALVAEFGKVWDGVRLLGSIQSAIVDHFAAKGESLTDVKDMLVISKTNPAGTEKFWRDLLVEDVKLTSAADVQRFNMWLHARNLGGGAGGFGAYSNDQARRALDVLDSHGMQVSGDIKTDLETALALGEAGSEREQCCNALVVHILYLGRAPEAIEETWWQDQYNRLGGRMGGRVEITKSPTYQKAHHKTSESVLTLERALKREERFNEWSVQTTDALNACGLPKAASMLMKVLAQTNRLAAGSWARKRIYLYGYFFEEHTGLGLPSEYATRSAFNAMAAQPPPGLERMVLDTPHSGSLGGSLGNDYFKPSGSFGEGGSGASSELKELGAMLKSTIEAGLAPLRDLAGGGGGGGQGGGSGSCMYCHQADCPMRNGGAPCRRAKHAGDLLRANDKAVSKKRAEAEAAKKEASGD